MDKEQAREILDGGQTNDLSKAGSLITDPNIVIQLVFNGEEFHTVFGSFELTDSDLDYAVHRAKEVTLTQKDQYYEDNQVEADVYVLSDNEVVVKRFKATPEQWEEVVE